MKYPSLIETQSTRQIVDIFGGYNHNLRINDGEFYDMKNLTSSHYPVLSPRKKRNVYVSVSNPLGMIAKDYLCYVDGDSFFINHYKVEGLVLDDSTHKSLVPIGAYVVILPDKKWVNTAKFNGVSFNPTDDNGNIDGYGDVEAKYETIEYEWGAYETTSFTPCKADGMFFTDEEKPIKSLEEPEDPVNGQFWLDLGTEPHSLKVYSGANGTWSSVATTYVCITSPGIGKKFDVYDGITIEGLSKDVVLNDNVSGEEITGDTRDQLADLEGSAIVWAKGDDYVVVVGILDEATDIKNKITITRKMPDMDFVIESQNRLWGCKYGVVDGKAVNEIYASQQGNFKNWNCFMGTSQDSYAASCGTDGSFTGAITHMGYPLFFKEGYMHKVYGNYPANYQIQTNACRGVHSGCSNSLAIVNEVLYYKSRTGVVAYDGSLPTEVSYALGDVRYYDAVACAHGNKYYISMMDEKGDYNLFVYDTKRSLWHKEDDLNVAMFCSFEDDLLYITKGSTDINTMFGTQIAILGGGTPTGKGEESVEWMAETGVLTTSSPDKKYISRLNVRMSLDIGTKVQFYIQYDSAGEWHHASSMTGTVLRTFSVPIRPIRCDHLRLRIVGVGDAKIYSITKTIEQGSDI